MYINGNNENINNSFILLNKKQININNIEVRIILIILAINGFVSLRAILYNAAEKVQHMAEIKEANSPNIKFLSYFIIYKS